MIIRLNTINSEPLSWEEINPVLAKGEIGISYDDLNSDGKPDTLKMKIGNGTDKWENLEYANITGGILSDGNLQIHLKDFDAHGLDGIRQLILNANLPEIKNNIETLKTDISAIDLQMTNINEEIQNANYNFVKKSGDTLTGILNMSNRKITNIADPTATQDAANKKYVDANSITKTKYILNAGQSTPEIQFSWDGDTVYLITATMTATGSVQSFGNCIWLWIPTLGSVISDTSLLEIKKSNNFITSFVNFSNGTNQSLVIKNNHPESYIKINLIKLV